MSRRSTRARPLAPDIGAVSDDMRAAIRAIDKASHEVQRAVDQDMRDTMGPVWRNELNARHQWPQDSLIIVGNRIDGGNPATLVTADSTTIYGRALVPIENWQGYEWGANKDRKRGYTRRSDKGKYHPVVRRVNADKPDRRKEGRVVTKAVRAILPRISAYWVQSVTRALTQALERR